MRHLRTIRVAVALLAVCVTSLLAAGAPTQEGWADLLRNGGFEKPLKSGSWTGKGNAWRGKGDAAISHENPYKGKGCLRMDAQAKSSYQTFTKAMPVNPGDELLVNFAWRGPYPKLLRGQVACQLRFYGPKTYFGAVCLSILRAPDRPDEWLAFQEEGKSDVRKGRRGATSEYHAFRDRKERRRFREHRLGVGRYRVPEGVNAVRVYLTASDQVIAFFDEVRVKVRRTGKAAEASGKEERTGGNLLANGGFEKALGSVIWAGKGNYYPRKGPKGECAVVQDKPRTGKSCLYVRGVKGRTFQILTKPIPVKPGEEMQLDACFRGPDLPGRVRLAVRLNAGRKGLGQYVLNLRETPESRDGWVRLREAARTHGVVTPYVRFADKKLAAAFVKASKAPGRFVVPEGADNVRVYLFVTGKGDVFFDDVVLVKIGADKKPPAAQPAAARPAAAAPVPEGSRKALTMLDRDEYRRLLFEQGKLIGIPRKVPGWSYRIVDPKLPDAKVTRAETGRFPRSATNLRIRDGLFRRGGRPAFVFHWEHGEVFDFWFYHVAGLDLAQLMDFYLANSMQVEVDRERKEVVVSNRDYPFATYMVPLALDAGVVAYVQPPENNYPAVYRKTIRRDPDYTRWTFGAALYRYFPELFVTQGHFISFRPGNRDAERIRENQWRVLLNRTRWFPAFAYETFNELYYRDWSFANLRRLQEDLKAKYGTLGRLNACLGTRFKSWSAVLPPHGGGGSGSHTAVGRHPDFTPGLWAEWVKVTERAAGDFLVRVAKFVKERAPNAYVTVQPRPSADFDGELVGSDIHQVIATHDFFAHEYASTWLRDVSGQDAEIPFLRRMVSSRIRLESARVTAEVLKKPILNAEGCPHGGTVIGDSSLKKMILVDLGGQWRFKQDPDGKARYEAPGLDDSAWARIKVPGVWGAQGYKDYDKPAWYRKRFRVERGHAGPVWLSGAVLSDYATVHVNGVRVHKTRKWSERFDVDVTPHVRRGGENVVAVKIEVNPGGIGGIRNYLYVTRGPLTTGGLEPEQLRAGVWSSVMHGSDGESFSYRAPRGQHNAFYNPKRTKPEAIAEMPYVTAEIKSLEPIILPKPRYPTQVGVLLSYDTKLEIINRDVRELMARNYSHGVADFFGPAIWSGLGAEVITDEMVRRGHWRRYRVLALPYAWRVHPRTLVEMSRFLDKGGVLIVGAGSLLKNHETNAPIALPKDFGFTWGAARKDDFVLKPKWRALSSGHKARRFELDDATGREIRPGAGAAVLAVDGKGKPTLVRVRRSAGGTLYVLGFHPDIPAFREVLDGVAKEAGLRPQLAVDAVEGEAPRAVQRQVLGGDGRYVWFAQDFGGAKRKVTLRPVGFAVPAGRYRVRDTKRFAPVPAPGGAAVWTAEELRRGVTVAMGKQDPVSLLVERADLKPTPAPDAALARERSAFLLHNFRPSPARKRIAFVPSTRVFYPIDAIPTARLILEAMGFQVDAGMRAGLVGKLRAAGGRAYPLSRVNLLVMTGPRSVRPQDAKAVWDHVEKGGRLLITAVPVWGNWWYRNRLRADRVTQRWGVRIVDGLVVEPDRKLLLDRVMPEYAVRTDAHPALAGVRKVRMRLTPWLKVTRPNRGVQVKATPLLWTSPTSTSLRRADKGRRPLAVALEVGKGRVVVVGSGGWLQPSTLPKADNARFLTNIVNWLTGAEPRPLPEATVRRCVRVPGSEEYRR